MLMWAVRRPVDLIGGRTAKLGRTIGGVDHDGQWNSPPRGSSSSCAGWAREIVTGLISLAITAVALVFLVLTFCAAAKPIEPAADGKPPQHMIDAYGRQKDILAIAMGLLGAVTGHYLGRASAERHADAARDAQRHAEFRETTTRRKALESADRLEQAVNEMQGGAAHVTLDDDAYKFREEIRKLRAELG